MKLWSTAPLIALLALGGCIAPTGPVQVTRFHAANVAPLGHGSIAVEPALGMDGNSLELKSFAAAVARQLQLVGYTNVASGGDQVALVKLSRRTYRPARMGSPVSVGIGGSACSYGSGMGVGVGIDLSGPPPEQVDTELAVAIKDRKSAAVLWEGRASFTVRSSSPLATTQLGAAKLAEALFKGFPGNSGETIEVK